MLKVVLLWRDFNGKDAEHGFNADEVTDRAGADSVVFAMVPALAALSDAVVVAVSAKQELPIVGTIAGPGSQVHRVAVVFFNNGGILSALRIPSGTLAAFDIPTSPYEDTRLLRVDAPAGLIVQLDELGALVVNPDYNSPLGAFVLIAVGNVI